MQNGGATRKVFKISIDKTSSPIKITVADQTNQPVPDNGVSFDDFYKSYVSDVQTGVKPMYIAVDVSADNKIENFNIKDANPSENDSIGVIVQTPGTQSSAANSSDNAVGVNQQGDATKTENQQIATTISDEQQVEANQSDKQQGKSDNQLVGVTNSVDKQGDNATSVVQQGISTSSNNELVDRRKISRNSSTRIGGKRNLTKRRKRRHSRK